MAEEMRGDAQAKRGCAQSMCWRHRSASQCRYSSCRCFGVVPCLKSELAVVFMDKYGRVRGLYRGFCEGDL